MKNLTFKEVDVIRHEAVKAFFDDSESVEEHTTMEFRSKAEVYQDMILFLEGLVEEDV